jgi:putative membrane protein
MPHPRLRLILSTLVGCLIAGAAAAQVASGAAAGSKLARADAAFLRQAAENGLVEIEAGKLAINKAVNTQVKGFAQQMVDEHTKANDELKSLAVSKGIQLPARASMGQRAKIDLLSSADGASFDRRYAGSIGVSAHESTIRLFQKAADRAADPDVKAFAAKMLPTLQHHLEMAHELKNVTAKEGNAKARGDRKQ